MFCRIYKIYLGQWGVYSNKKLVFSETYFFRYKFTLKSFAKIILIAGLF